MSDTYPTTARALGKFRTELLDSGVPADLADDIVRDAARVIVADDGLGVEADV